MRFFHLLFLLSFLVLITGASAGLEEGEIMTDQKTDFPEMVGMNGAEAKAQLESQFPSFQIDIVPWDAMLTMDYREDRIRIKVDESGKVKKSPRVG
ncbi:unnamed protein product [Cylindrotheca closterium]|uniref:Subtilisin n=1 Tax=Cylindrotheca closterium TaxID=2856 RepID=A0AAD2G4S8_9STRA|nr:unnamed protein product [Cylindrotheca closterium]